MKTARDLILVLCIFAAGCSSTYNPATGRNEFIYISTPAEVEMGEDIHRNITGRYRLSTDEAALQRVERIGQDLVHVSDRQDYAYHFYVIEEDEMNAFTAPGGNIYVHSGLLNKLRTDDQLAAVLAHEIGHCAARHSVKKFQAALTYDLIGQLVLSQIDSVSAQRMANLSSNAVMSIVFSSYSRKDEHEADRLAIKYMYLAGYDPQAIIETFEILKEEEKEGVRMPQILRSHPYLDDRIEAVKEGILTVKDNYGGVTAAR
ncbi:MAG TPA: M48 family metallopeptidase [Candidatus Omnitrophota bacterium]|nr:M48 family metallopeptidase [Candidatus Omnitrophota bacterium]